MDKNWLIRTKSNHILGPISKEKVLELYHNGSIKPDDEVCAGNGYWFFIREDDMVSRFLLGNEIQGFNPISEAKDVLTSGSSKTEKSETRDDITMVGGLNLSLLNEAPDKPLPKASDILVPSGLKPDSQSAPKETVPSETKKKNNLVQHKKSSPSPAPKKVLKKQNWLKYVGYLGFLLLFCLIYFRKTIIQHLFQGEITAFKIELIDSAYAQEDPLLKKKKILESSFTIDKVTFRPVIGLDGFRVLSEFDIESLKCDDLKSDIFQLGVILHSPETINEKFLLRLRDCVLGLPDNHVLKKWMKWVGKPKALSSKEQKTQAFLTEIINSQFNLITDPKIKLQITNTLHEIPDETVPEKLLRAYLYGMVGNLTHSDNILREILRTPPRENWTRVDLGEGLYHRLARAQAQQILTKLSHHPADRKTFQLLSLYIQNFYNDEALLDFISDVSLDQVESRLGLKYVEGIAPSLIHYLRLSRMNDNRRIRLLRDMERFPLKEQAYWDWAFMDIDPLVSDAMVPELVRIEKEDELWFIYLMNNEKLADLFAKKAGKSFLPARRGFLKEGLKNRNTLMMSLYKLIELGDINEDLIQEVTQELIHD